MAGSISRAAAIKNASIAGELFAHWTKLGTAGLRYGSGELGEKRRALAEEAAAAAAEKTGLLSIERMGTAAWAATWEFDYKGAAAAALEG